jgi:hypothetical protein
MKPNTMLRPNPVPRSFLVVKNGSKMCSLDVRRHPLAGIGEFDHRIVARGHIRVGVSILGIEPLMAGRDRQLSAAGHRGAGIGRKIGESGLELRRVGDDGAGILAKLRA